MRSIRLAAAAALSLGAGAAHAEDRDPCAPDMVCASSVDSVMAAAKAAGYAPKLEKDKDGTPYIEIDSGYHFDIFFYGCVEGRNCDSLRFEVSFGKEAGVDIALANKWNDSKRFLQMAVKDDGTLLAAYDVATVGGLNKKNFADVLGWWDTLLVELSEFFEANLPKKES